MSESYASAFKSKDINQGIYSVLNSENAID